MFSRIAAVIAVCGLAVTGLTVGTAHAAGGWVANSPSSILNSGTVRLLGGNTSVENQDLDVPVQAGDVVSFRYQLLGGATCTAGAPRVFVEVGGVFTNSWDQLQPGGTQCGTNGVVSFTVPSNGRIGQAGIVYDNGGPGAVLVSNLTVDGRSVRFSRPVPDVQVTPTAPTVEQPKCDATRGALTIPSVRGVTYTVAVGRQLPDTWSAGVRPVRPGVYKVTAVAKDGYRFPRGADARWVLVVKASTACPTPTPTPTPTVTPKPTVTPTTGPTPQPSPSVSPAAVVAVKPVVEQSSCATEGVARMVIPEVEGVVYSGANGVAKAGKYIVKPSSVTVSAAAAEGYTLAGDPNPEWTLPVNDPPVVCPGPAGEDGKDGKTVTVSGIRVPSRIDTGLGGTA
ncbi:MAG: hypothetical protein ABR585_07885 [Gemmatimonadaceae bacterium]